MFVKTEIKHFNKIEKVNVDRITNCVINFAMQHGVTLNMYHIIYFTLILGTHAKTMYSKRWYFDD